MTKYDVIYEALQQQVDEGSLTVEDAEVLNDVAYEKYADVEVDVEESVDEDSYDNDSITLEEAMYTISDYLTEGGGARKRYLENLVKKQDDARKKIADANMKKTNESKNNRAEIEEFNAKVEYDNAAQDARKYSQRAKKALTAKQNNLKNALDERDTMHTKRTEENIDKEKKMKFMNDFGKSPRANTDSKYGEGDRGINTIPDKLKNKSVKESVDELRLQVYEAFEAGQIDDDEKTTFLDYLNLENYQ